MISWFEIAADDLNRAKKFYSELFGWKIEEFPVPFRRDCLLIRTGDGNTVAGGLIKRKDPQQTTVNYIDVPSTDKYIVKVKSLGGKVLVPKTAVPGMGYFVVFEDTEDNAFGIWEDDVNAS